MACRRRGFAFAGVRCAALLLAFLAEGVAPASARRRPAPSAEDVAFTRHLARVRQFPCSAPQPRALTSSHVIEEGGVSILTSEMIFPVMTVLHRCDAGSGCCMQGSGLLCGPAKEAEVVLDFKLMDAKTRMMRHINVTAHNHTKCACMENFPK